MKLYVCYGTFKSRKAGGHPCRHANEALVDAGYQPDVVKTYGCVLNPAFKGRREVKELTGNYQVPTLVLDDGSLIDGTDNIIAWAKANAQHGAGPGRHLPSARLQAQGRHARGSGLRPRSRGTRGRIA